MLTQSRLDLKYEEEKNTEVQSNSIVMITATISSRCMEIVIFLVTRRTLTALTRLITQINNTGTKTEVFKRTLDINVLNFKQNDIIQ